MQTILPGLIRFTTYVEPINLSFNQYLLLGEKPLLVHTGDHASAKALLPKLEMVLDGKPLSFLFVSHFEADECGGLAVILAKYPEVRVLCSAVTARQFSGFGIPVHALVQGEGDRLTTADYDLTFIAYPSEMHLWDGLLAVDRKQGILFSSDLVFRYGRVGEKPLALPIEGEIRAILPGQVPGGDKRETLIEKLLSQPIQFIATGHGDWVERG